ncbi:hypothetical protein SAMN05216267_10915 [Actinacidiphila rubida]|uniref:Esterase n=1 Tax=Actinacidiphila rubida TaxID=310780 RepID=A0A1H8UY31_9ACTN|nr:hypothetical protein [Actinacidiphila rubida]SEP07883.1 hypothetical protein SAMN05216267_10915 [Actinacidiphila rubida]
MTTDQRWGRSCCDRAAKVRRAPRRNLPRTGAGRPALSLVPGSDTRRVGLSELTGAPMPADVRGAIVTPSGGGLTASWLPLSAPDRVPPGRVLLSWTPAGPEQMDVTAHLGLPGGRVLLAMWPGLRGDWSTVVRPTVTEVAGLHSALRLATLVAERLGG